MRIPVRTRPRLSVAETQALVTEDYLSLAPGEIEARARFDKLTDDTRNFMESAGPRYGAGPYSPSPESAGNFLSGNYEGRHPDLDIPPALVERWRAWNLEYYAVRARNPALELRDLMQDLSERVDGSSWPYDLELPIEDWIEAGDPSVPPPFDERAVEPDFFRRLQELRQACKGWLYWDDASRRVVFAPEEEWRRIRAAREEAEKARARNIVTH